MTNLSSSAAIAVAINRQSATPIVNVLQLVSLLIGLVIVFLVGRAVKRSSALHPNLRLLLGNLLLCGTVKLLADLVASGVSVGRLIRHLIIGDDGTALLARQTTCKLTGIVGAIGIVGNMFFLFSLAMERTYATLNYRTYEAVKNTRLSLSLCAIQWSITMILVGGSAVQLYGDANRATIEVLPHCLLNVLNTAAEQLSSPTQWWLRHAITLGIQTLASLPFLVIWRVNSRRRIKLVATAELSSRFQLKENINMSIALAKLVLVHAAWDVLRQTWSYHLLARVAKGDSPPFEYVANQQLLGLWTVIGITIESAMIAGRGTTLARFMPKWFQKLTYSQTNYNTVDVPIEQHRSVYFKSLEDQWKVPKKQEKASSAVARRSTVVHPTTVEMHSYHH